MAPKDQHDLAPDYYFLCPLISGSAWWHWPVGCSSTTWISFLPQAFILDVSCPDMLLSETLYSMFFNILQVYVQFCPSCPDSRLEHLLSSYSYSHRNTITIGNVFDWWMGRFSSLLFISPPARTLHKGRDCICLLCCQVPVSRTMPGIYSIDKLN